MWDLPGPGIKPVSPVLTGRFFTTEPPGKPHRDILDHRKEHYQGDLSGLPETNNISNTPFHSQKYSYSGDKLYDLAAHDAPLILLST